MSGRSEAIKMFHVSIGVLRLLLLLLLLLFFFFSFFSFFLINKTSILRIDKLQ
jgi:hypothetical protein